MRYADDVGRTAAIMVGGILAYLMFDRLLDRFGYVGGAE
jgi:hypothetical protein